MRSGERIKAARRDYDFGFSRPREVCGVKDIDVEVLDRGVCPDAILEAVQDKGIDIGKIKVKVLAAGLSWSLRGRQQLTLKLCDGVVRVYDPLVSETITEPTMDEVAQWHCVSSSYLKNVAADEGWKKERDNRLKEEEEEVRIALRRRAVHDRLAMYDEHMDRHKALQGSFDERFLKGEIEVTVRDVLASMQLQERETRGMAQTEDHSGNSAGDFLRLLASAGLLEIKKEVVVDAEVVAIEEPKTD